MLSKIAQGAIKIYQSARKLLFPAVCRFSPSCSEYARQAIVKYGLLRGFWLGLKRILACHPFSGRQGYDPLI